MMNPASHRPKILVLHHDPLLSVGLVTILSGVTTLDVQAGTDDPLALETPAPDVVIADYCSALRLLDGVARGACDAFVRSKILALTTHNREVDIRRAMRAGIHGYLMIGGSLDELIEAVKTVVKGGRFMCRAATQRIADSMNRAALTRRESAVLRLMAAGEANKAIARHLDIEVGTVKSHVSVIMTKLGATSRTQAAHIAVTRGLIEDEADLDEMDLPPLAAQFERRALAA
jgi:DNA-binding NarL/FixJ family response regulator